MIIRRRRIRRSQKKSRSFQKSQKWSLGLREVVLRPYDEIKKCSDSHLESSHMGKNSSRRTPRPKNLIFLELLRRSSFDQGLRPFRKC